MTEHHSLYLVVAVIAFVAALTWLVFGAIAQLIPKASLSFSLGNLMLCISGLLVARRAEVSDFLHWQGAALLGVFCMLLFRFGVASIFKLPIRYRGDVLVIALTFTIYLFLTPDVGSLPLMAALYSANIVYFCFRIMLDLKKWTGPMFSRKEMMLNASPFLLLALIMFIRIVVVATVDADKLSKINELWMPLTYVTLTLLINVSLLVCIVAFLIGKLRLQAERDYLSGLYNRRAFEKHFHGEVARFERTQQPFSLIMFDIDHFKRVNDQYGHAAGDAAIRHIARLLEDSVRRIDICARMGGEEFCVLLPYTTLTDAKAFAERFRLLLNSSPLQWRNHSIAVKCSFGVGESRMPNLVNMIEVVDKALYSAKAAGRNRVLTVDENILATE